MISASSTVQDSLMSVRSPITLWLMRHPARITHPSPRMLLLTCARVLGVSEFRVVEVFRV